jgi:integrase
MSLAVGGRRRPCRGFAPESPPRNKGRIYPADPPTVDEIVAVMRHARHARHGCRLNGLIVVLWRAGLRIHEALSLTETDLDQRRGSILIRHGKGDRRREVGMDAWAWSALQPWLDARAELPVGPLFCVIDGATRGRPWSASAARLELHRTAIVWSPLALRIVIRPASRSTSEGSSAIASPIRMPDTASSPNSAS